MPLSPGTRVGVYDITALIGAGGMGEVYRARDTALGRDVALKTLPDVFAADADRVARFQREAQLLAALNHPHIAAIYGLEESSGVRALVLEFVDGPTLADRIARGPIPVDEALVIARQICDALDAAHERGIVHRDLKPSNIKLADDRRVKVLDFGLAKLVGADGADAAPVNRSMSPTLTVQGTFAGVVLGTAAYMSPEQAKGRAADRASDVWAFGCVLFEMLTGRPAFDGETVSDILADVLRREPDWSRLPEATPEPIRRLLQRSLRKDRTSRLHDVSDARIEIDDAIAAPLSPAHSSSSIPNRRGAIWWAVAASFVAIAAVSATAMMMLRSTEPAEAIVDIATPPTLEVSSFALAPDGRAIVYAGISEGRTRLFVRSLQAMSARVLAGTEDAMEPFWSPDGRSLGFFAGGKLKRVDVAGGAPRTLANAVAPAGGAWGLDDTILYSPNSSNGPVFRIPASGGESTAVTRLQIGEGHRTPQLLPDGRHFIYTIVGPAERRGGYVSELSGGNGRRFIDADDVRFAPPAHVVFLRQGTLFAQRFDAARQRLEGVPVPVADQIAQRVVSAVSAAAGHLAFRTGAASGLRQFMWVDRTGAELSRVGEPLVASNPSISPDGRHVAMQRTVDGNIDVWVLELGPRQVLTRLTSDPTLDGLPLWSPDGRRVAFSSSRSSYSAIHIIAADGSGKADLLMPTQGTKAASLMDWSSDGKTILYRSIDLTGGNADLWAVSVDTGKPYPVIESPFDERDAQFSPDGKWIAYSSDESGRPEVYVQPFPGPGGKERLSTNGGTQVRWRRDERELFYVAADMQMMSVAIHLDAGHGAVEEEPPKPLFAARSGGSSGFSRQQYAVSPDGDRFLIGALVSNAAPSPPITLILNWRPAER